MFERLMVLTLVEGGIFILAAVLLFPASTSAQLFVRPLPADGQRQTSPLMDGSPVDTTADPAATSSSVNPRGIGAAGTDDAQAAELIREYREAAGTVGPRKVFSDFKLDPHASLGVAYDDNILVSTGKRKLADVITTPAAGLTVLLGDFATRTNNFLVFNYTATGELFAKHDDNDALNHDVSLIVRYRPHDFMTQLTSTYQYSHDATADIGERVAQQIFADSLLFRYFRNDRTTLEAEVDFAHNTDGDFSDSTQIWGGAAVDYKVADKVTLGAGVIVGHLEATDDLNELYEQFQARLGYTITDKVSLSLRGGFEVRERGSRAGTEVNPVFSLTGTWTPYDGTALTAEGHRRTEASGSLLGEDYISTGIQFGLRQRLVRRFYVSLDAGYENADYQNVTEDRSTSRNDDYFNLRAAFGYDFVEWVKLEAVYTFRTDRSNQSTYSFESNRFGLQASFIY